MKESDRGIYREYLGKTLALLGRIFVCRGFSHFGISTRMGESLEPLICFWTVLFVNVRYLWHTHTHVVPQSKWEVEECSLAGALTTLPRHHHP